MKSTCGLFKHNCIQHWMSDLKGFTHFKVFPTKKLKKYLCLLWVRKCGPFGFSDSPLGWALPLSHLSACPGVYLSCVCYVFTVSQNVHSWIPHMFNVYSKHQVFTDNSPQTAVPSNTLARCRLLVLLFAWPAPLLQSWPGWWLHAFWCRHKRTNVTVLFCFRSRKSNFPIELDLVNSSASLGLLPTVPLSQVCPSLDLCLLILNIPPAWEAVSPNAEHVRLWKQKYRIWILTLNPVGSVNLSKAFKLSGLQSSIIK